MMGLDPHESHLSAAELAVTATATVTLIVAICLAVHFVTGSWAWANMVGEVQVVGLTTNPTNAAALLPYSESSVSVTNEVAASQAKAARSKVKA